eukprot:TRINITY_DN3032_c0_g1_i1.p1 TRINITY_DN3032_c0_g1~~TRINITY_DN3032_c0_g1_i1.p1  ORF type:complete len:241 (+),score=60.81 TRINITY_DN3032_c0_g1_i1:182-904(+)
MHRESDPLLGGDNFSFVISSLSRLNSNVKLMSELVDQIGIRFDTALRQKMIQVREETISLVKSIKTQLTRPYDVRHKIQHDKLTCQFQELLRLFENLSRLSLKKEQEVVFQLEKRRESQEAPVLFQTQASLPNGMTVLDVESTIIEERNKEIKDLERDLSQLAECFSDMSQMVDQQGELIDNTENAVVAAEQHVEEGAVRLQEAQVYQNKARKKIMILIFCCFCLIAVGGGIIAWWFLKK